MLKEMLGRFIPLIRFAQISLADFNDKIRPYEAVISHCIFKELIEFYHKGTLPNTINPIPHIIPSTIIQSRLAIIIANWIDRNDSNVLSFNTVISTSLI